MISRCPIFEALPHFTRPSRQRKWRSGARPPAKEPVPGKRCHTGIPPNARSVNGPVCNGARQKQQSLGKPARRAICHQTKPGRATARTLLRVTAPAWCVPGTARALGRPYSPASSFTPDSKASRKRALSAMSRTVSQQSKGRPMCKLPAAALVCQACGARALTEAHGDGPVQRHREPGPRPMKR